MQIALNGLDAFTPASVAVVVFPRLGGRPNEGAAAASRFNAFPSLAAGRKPSTAAIPFTLMTLGLRPRTVSFRSARRHA
jgi:hypothetical protein